MTHYLAILAATSGDFDEAERRFADATASHERIGAPTWLARTRLKWARMLLNRAQPGEPTGPANSSVRPSPLHGSAVPPTSSAAPSNS